MPSLPARRACRFWWWALPIATLIRPSTLSSQVLSQAEQRLAADLIGGISRPVLQRGLAALAPLDRISGGPGERKAAEYLTGELSRLGIPFEVHRLRFYLSWPVQATLTVGTRQLKAVTPSFSASTQPAGLRGIPVLFGKSGHPFTGEGRAEGYADVRGKIAVIEGLVEPQDGAAAQAAGAIGVININENDLLHEMIVTTVWGTPGVEDLGRIPRLPVLSISHADGAAVREAIRLNRPVILHTTLETGCRETPLVVAEIRGSSDQFVLLSAHLDAWYEGMSDTGAGDVMLLEIARLMQEQRGRLRRGLRIAWWTGHSTGRYAGSTWYADNYWAELDQRCVGYMNLDGPGTRGVPLDRASTWAWPELMQYVDAMAQDVTRAEPIHEYMSANPDRIRPARAGDSSFQGLGIPEFSVGVAELAEGHPDRRSYAGGSQGAWWWHTRDDTVDKVDMNVVVRDLEWRLPSLVGILNRKVLPYRLSNTARQYRKALDEYATDRFQLTSTRVLADSVEAAAHRLELAAVEQPEGVSDEEAARVNRALLRASHLLNATLYTTAGRFHQDPAVPQPLLPSLAGLRELASLDPVSERYGFVMASVIRGRNRVDQTLRDAAEVLNRVP